MENFVCMQFFHRHEPRSILWPEELRPSAISQSASRTRRLARPRGVARARGSGRTRRLVRIARSGS
jgi:hypothetical protein